MSWLCSPQARAAATASRDLGGGWLGHPAHLLFVQSASRREQDAGSRIARESGSGPDSQSPSTWRFGPESLARSEVRLRLNDAPITSGVREGELRHGRST